MPLFRMFGKRKKQEQKIQTVREAITPLLIKVAEMAATHATSLSESMGISDSSKKWEIHTEVLGLYCHAVSRWAFEIGGLEFRARLQDLVTPFAIDYTIDSFWNTAQAQEGFDTKSWKERMKAELLRNINSAELEYGDCPHFIGPAKTFALSEDNVFGRFGKNIAQLADKDWAWQLAHGSTMPGVLAESGIRDEIERTWHIVN